MTMVFITYLLIQLTELYPNQPHACQNSRLPDEIIDIIIPSTKQAVNSDRVNNATERRRLLILAGNRGYMPRDGSTAFPEAAAMVF
ncbi:MAG: hypothetical protein GX957_03540 [Clostridiaceae bacterium]|nr:hypothetical protein [Clostridiaceae bacterium]